MLRRQKQNKSHLPFLHLENATNAIRRSYDFSAAPSESFKLAFFYKVRCCGYIFFSVAAVVKNRDDTND
jgi:hypothetical protein